MRFLTASFLALALALLAAGCSGRGVIGEGRPGRSPTVVVVGGERGGPPARGKGKAKGPRHLKVPPGHYPPRGMCRLWYAGRPPGQQPAPVPCARLRGSARGTGAFILYNGSAWDADYDWRLEERRKPRSIPAIIIEVTTGR